MNKIYLVVKAKRLGDKMYFCRGRRNGTGTGWTFNIADAITWETDRMPKIVSDIQNSTEVKIITMTKTEYFKRVLAGK